MVNAAFTAPLLSSYLASGTLSSLFPLLGISLGAAFIAWSARFPKIAVAFLCGSLILGQLVRLPLPGQGGGLLLSDIAVVCTLLAAVVYIWRQNGAGQPTTYFLLTLPFLFWSLFSLLLHLPDLELSERMIAAAYWLRLTANLLLLPALLFLFSNASLRPATLRLLVLTLGAVVCLGFAQLILMPNLDLPGWDPHRARLFSSWLDPNLFGAFLLLLLPLPFTRLFSFPRLRLPLLILIVATVLALLLTQSRSSLLAGIAVFLSISPFLLLGRRLSRETVIVRSFIAGSMLLTVAASAFLLLGKRSLGLFQLDETIWLRLSALGSAWPLIQDHWLSGVGYNTYQFAAVRAGLLSDLTLHSRAGLDNSFLTLWATTGIVGVVLFLIPFAAAARALLRQWFADRQPIAAAALTAMIGLSVHAQFVNSFLYSHLLITLMVILALALTNDQTPMTNVQSSPKP